MCVCECLEQATYPAHTYLAYLMVKFCLPHHVGHVVESGVFPVGGALIGEQPVSVCVRKTSRSWLSPPTPRRAPPSGKKNTRVYSQAGNRWDNNELSFGANRDAVGMS